MPVMDGFEATRRITEEERYYGVHIPIIALTDHRRGGGEEANKMMQSELDFHLPKPLNREQLMEAIHHIH
ncbi:histidine kinase 3 [Actinidia rufa]|uniref:Histidine kinase 3 n=1 Tax=Actinidia rufa TaxID=165716 RepID=A0A7J0DEX2_9ERIC|nr:histidine kinase 3 [Actinidia rufa]